VRAIFESPHPTPTSPNPSPSPSPSPNPNKVRAIFESAGDDAKFGWCTVNLKLGGRLNYEDV
jgi:hypothetical protein